MPAASPSWTRRAFFFSGMYNMRMKLGDHLRTLSHHAYCIVGTAEAREELLSILEKKHKVSLRGNPDLFDRTYETFAIDDAREVKAQSGMRPVSESGKKIFVLCATGVTAEAQNALLKLLEEPPEYAHFFLIIPSAHLLLHTVKSRLYVIDSIGAGAADKTATVASEEAKEFLGLPPAKRLDFIKRFMEEITKEKRPKQDAIDLLNSLEEAIHKKGVEKNMPQLQALELSRAYMNDRAPSLKMLLEYVALSC